MLPKTLFSTCSKKTHTKKELWLVYNTLIRSTIEYANPLFISLKKSLIHKIENLQIRAHYIICGDIKKCKCKLESLEERRKKAPYIFSKKLLKRKTTCCIHYCLCHFITDLYYRTVILITHGTASCTNVFVTHKEF